MARTGRRSKDVNLAKKPAMLLRVDKGRARTAALSEDQVLEVISSAVGSKPTHCDKAARFIEWQLTATATLRVEFSADVILVRQSGLRSRDGGRSKPSNRFIIQLYNQQAEKQIIAAVQAVHRATSEAQKSTVMRHL